MTQLRYNILVFLTSFLMLCSNFGQGIRNVVPNTDEFPMQEGTVKTIKSEDGDVIDCVSIEKQPSFNHPLLKDHVVQLQPSIFPSGIDLQEKVEPSQIWNEREECPQGSIPIRRTLRRHTHQDTVSFAAQKIPFNRSLYSDFDSHEHAMATLGGGEYRGAQGTFNVWSPEVEDADFSLAQMWIIGGAGGNALNTIETGWTVYPERYRDRQPRLFVYWTIDNYQKTGCYDLECPGFVQTDRRVALGSAIKTVSTYDGKQADINILVFKDPKTGNWWLKYQDIPLGYWPSKLFTSLADVASSVAWGGEVFNSKPNGHHTTAQMGSGHFPGEGVGKSSYIKLKYLDSSNALKDPENPVASAEKPKCYDARYESNTLFYGGPGYSAQCP